MMVTELLMMLTASVVIIREGGRGGEGCLGV